MSVVAPEGLKVDEDLGFRVHPFADVFPKLEGAEFDELVEDIKANGQQEPILYIFDAECNEVIVDGRNRLRACRKLGIGPDLDLREPDTEEELLALIWSKNIHRRHLNASQRAMLVIEQKRKFVDEIAKAKAETRKSNLKRGTKRATKSRKGTSAPSGSTAETIAKTAGVSPRTAKDARAVQKSGDEELIEEVKAGRKSVKAAAKEVREKKAPTKRPTKKGAAAGPPPGLAGYLPYMDADGHINPPARLSPQETPQQAAKELLEIHGREWCTSLVTELDVLLEIARAAQ